MSLARNNSVSTAISKLASDMAYGEHDNASMTRLLPEDDNDERICEIVTKRINKTFENVTNDDIITDENVTKGEQCLSERHTTSYLNGKIRVLEKVRCL